MGELKFRVFDKISNKMREVSKINFSEQEIISYDNPELPFPTVIRRKFKDIEIMQYIGIIDKNAKEIANYLRPLYLDTNNERIYALCFDLQDRLIACRIVSDGDIDSSVLDARKLAAIVLEVKAKKVILSHNHPNGTVTPSV